MFAQARENQFFLWTYMANIKMSLDAAWCFGYLDHFWSLSVEEHFYLVWPFVLFLCTPRVALKVALAMAVGSALSRVMFAAFGDNGVAPDVLTIFRCDALLLGSILAMQIRLPEGLQPLRKLSWIVFPICLTLGLACSVLGIRAWTISHSLWPLLWCCVLIWLLSSSERSWLARFFNNSGLQKLGKYSYGMYVFQNPLIPLSATVCSAPVFIQWFGNPIVGHAVYMAWMFALTFGAALLSWHLLEKHCLRLKVWFPLQPSPATVQVRSAREMLPAIN
jgi:peptidoglycan/LPS O-acetylase OafA/YrhL